MSFPVTRLGVSGEAEGTTPHGADRPGRSVPVQLRGPKALTSIGAAPVKITTLTP